MDASVKRFNDELMGHLFDTIGAVLTKVLGRRHRFLLVAVPMDESSPMDESTIYSDMPQTRQVDVMAYWADRIHTDISFP